MPLRVDVVLGADHAGLALCDELARRLRAGGRSTRNVSLRGVPRDDYPDVAVRLTDVVLAGGATRGILLCGSGVGASVAANKRAGIRAGLCHDAYSARQGVEDDDMNVLVLGARVIGSELAATLVEAFLQARFSRAPRHLRRLRKVRRLEAAAVSPSASAPAADAATGAGP
jgi:ribose 5-phosphate isomerase B